MTKRQDLCLQRRSRPEQSGQRQPNQAANISHQPGASPDSTSLASRIEFPTMTAIRRALDSRDQVRRLPRPSSSQRRGRQIFTRRDNDWTYRFRKIAADAWRVNAGSAIIDDEVVVQAADGTTEFSVRVERSPLI